MSKVPVNWGATAHDRSVKLYEIYNTAHQSLLVLAPDRDTALKIAHTANHVHWVWPRKDTSYPHVAELHDPFSRGRFADSRDSITIAIDRRLQGTVHFNDERVFVGEEAISA